MIEKIFILAAIVIVICGFGFISTHERVMTKDQIKQTIEDGYRFCKPFVPVGFVYPGSPICSYELQ